MNMKEPCKDCPFRTDIEPYLYPKRIDMLERELVDEQKTFTCHKKAHSLGYDKSKDEVHCAGALIILEKLKRPNQWMRIAERIGMYDRSELNMNAPIFNTFKEMGDVQ